MQKRNNRKKIHVLLSGRKVVTKKDANEFYKMLKTNSASPSFVKQEIYTREIESKMVFTQTSNIGV